jgi:hypothetical protein
MRIGPCLCGDTACPYCGPMLGGQPDYCEVCGMHVNAESDVQHDHEKCAAKAQADADELARDLAEDARLAREYWEEEKRRPATSSRAAVEAILNAGGGPL